eukprot:768293-Hanusia_phi.AAC.2
MMERDSVSTTFLSRKLRMTWRRVGGAVEDTGGAAPAQQEFAVRMKTWPSDALIERWQLHR